MLNLKHFSKVSSGARLQFGQLSLAQKNTLYIRLAHTNTTTSSKSSVGKYVLGSLLFGFSTIVVYAKYDTQFRQWLKTNVYGSDELLKLILFEDNSTREESISIKSKLGSPANNYTMDNSKLTTLKSESKEPKIIVEKTDKKMIEKDKISGINTVNKPSNIREIEIKATLLYNKVSDSYSEVLFVLNRYYELVNDILNAVSYKSNTSSLEKLKKITTEKDKIFQTAKITSQEASTELDRLLYLIDDLKSEISNEEKEIIKNDIKKYKADIKTLGKNFESELDKLSLYDKSNSQIINIRKQFSDELQMLFPHVRLEDKDMKLTDAEFNVFVEYVTQKLLFYQNELFKQETIGEEHVIDTVHALKTGNPNAIDKVLEFKIEKNRRSHMENFIKESFGSKASSEAKLKQQLRLKTEIHIDHLKEAASLAEKEVDRRVRLEYTEKAEIEKLKYQEQVSSMTAVMHAINDALKEHSEKRSKLIESVSLWTACQSLFSAITTDNNASKHELKPLQELVNKIKKSGDKHVIVKELLDTIPERVLTRGIYTEETLKDRFFSVEDKAFHMALVPDKNVKLFELVTSFVFTIFHIKTAEPIPKEELNNSFININELNNIDILQRARYWIDRDNYHQALKYMNLLKGGAKIIADDWMNETREYLATKQAAYTLLAYASASLHSHIGNTSTQ